VKDDKDTLVTDNDLRRKCHTCNSGALGVTTTPYSQKTTAIELSRVQLRLTPLIRLRPDRGIDRRNHALTNRQRELRPNNILY
jgi:hypothetical protein